MKNRHRLFSLLIALNLILTITVPIARAKQKQGRWWETVPEDEVPSPYYDSILYGEIAPALREIEVKSNRVRVEVIGQSAGRRNLFLVTVSAPEAFGRLGRYQALRQLMLKDPEKAQEMIDEFDDFKVPFYIHASVHGNEYPGVDAAIELIRTLAFEDAQEVRMILDNVIVLINVVANPDGRVLGTRRNEFGFDLNRDFITQSQPETEATVHLFTEWNPMVVLDLHGFARPMLIEPCTPPHNPNYEYDLYIKWALKQAEAMEAELSAQTGFPAQIPFRDFDYGWDDWPPIFTPMNAMYHGAYGHTLETSYRDERGVDAHYAAAWGALKFVSENRKEMIRDQIEIFRRGFLDLPQVPISDEVLEETPYEQYNELTLIEFPTAYVIPAEAPLQQSPHQAARLVDFLIFNDVEVERTSEAFALGDLVYPKGTYIVWMDQPKRGLANTILWDGWDISYDPGLTMYDISGWSHPLLWGASREIMEEKLDVETHTINRAEKPQGFVEGGRAAAYAYLPTSNEGIKATNELLARDMILYRANEPFEDSGHDFGTGTFIIPADQADVKAVANELARRYGMSIFTLQAIPDAVSLMREQRLAVHADEGVLFFLKSFGFDYDTVTTDDLNMGIDLSEYDLFIHSGWRRLWDDLTVEGKAALQNFFEGGGHYIGIGRSGVYLNVEAGLLDVVYETGSRRDNGIIRVEYDPEDSVAAQYPVDSYGFVYGPVWFTEYAGLEVSAYVEEGEFFVSGFWWEWETSGSAEKSIVLHGAKDSSIVTLMGIDPTFRAHPEHTYRILANAIYNAIE